MNGKGRIERDGKYVVYHDTGFDIVNDNPNLKYVLVGITPGNNQRPKNDEKEALGAEFGSINYKFKKAFSGNMMRPNLGIMFAYINKKTHEGIFDELLESCGSNIESLFCYSEKSIIDFTSLLKNATFKKTKDGSEKMFNKPNEINEKNKELYEQEFLPGFKKDYDEVYSHRDVIYIACGVQVYNFLITNMGIDKNKVIAIVHPSPSAQYYIKSFIGAYADQNKRYNPERLYEKKNSEQQPNN